MEMKLWAINMIIGGSKSWMISTVALMSIIGNFCPVVKRGKKLKTKTIPRGFCAKLLPSRLDWKRTHLSITRSRVIENQEVYFERGHKDKDWHDNKTEYVGTPMSCLIMLLSIKPIFW